MGWWIPAIAAGASLLGSLLNSGDKTVTQTQSSKRSQTPYRVKMPSGAVLTMYAHGDPSTTTKTTTEGGNALGNVLSAAGSGLGAYSIMGKGASTFGAGAGSSGSSDWWEQYLKNGGSSSVV